MHSPSRRTTTTTSRPATSHLLTLAATTLLALLPTPTTAHIILENPRPYIFAEYGPSNPLNPDGSNYPCKIPAGVTRLEIDGSPTPIPIGAPQTLSFTGLAVHGGGSCQLALTPGFEPNRDSQWSVIHSIEGGCPVANRAGNLEEGESPDRFEWSVPDGVEPGEYTFAWTWVNRISGATEFYMNCAPIEVLPAEGSSARVRERRAAAAAAAAAAVVEGEMNGVSKRQTTFPALFKANLGEVSNGCNTEEARAQQIAISYPNPGSSVAHPEGTDNLLPVTCDGNGGAAVDAPLSPPPTGAGAGEEGGEQEGEGAGHVDYETSDDNDNGESNTPPPVEPSYVEPAAPTTTPSPSPSPFPSTFPMAIPSDLVAEPTTAPVPETSYPTTPVVDDSYTPPPVAADSCQDGHFMCMAGGKTFSICTGGIWTPAQQLAENQRCTGEGESSAGLVVETVY